MGEKTRDEWLFISLIILVAFVLRILPYLMGYPIPITDDSMRDFQQVRYLIDNGSINFSDPYGAFPVLHLIVFFFSSLLSFVFSPMSIFLFIPQIFASFGIFFFYLFARRNFGVRIGLLSAFIIAVFSSHIYWSSQPVRETIGLFFFPLVILFFDYVVNEKPRPSVLFSLIIAFFLLVLSHNWSTLMAVVFLFSYSMFFAKSGRKGLAFLLTGLLSFIALFYWSLVFNFAFNLIALFFKPVFLILILLTLVLFLFYRKLDLDLFRKRSFFILISLLFVGFIGLYFLFLRVFSYPFYVYLSYLSFGFLFFIGFFINKSNSASDSKTDIFTKIASVYLFAFIFDVLFNYFGQKSLINSFDSLRVLEFFIFPASICAARGLIFVKEKIRGKGFALIVILMAFSGVMVYPSIFVFKTNFYGTPFYDIRSDVRYVSGCDMGAVAYANEQNYSVISARNVVNEYQEIFYLQKDKKLFLLSDQDLRIEENYGLIKDKLLGLSSPSKRISDTLNIGPFYAYHGCKLYFLE